MKCIENKNWVGAAVAAGVGKQVFTKEMSTTENQVAANGNAGKRPYLGYVIAAITLGAAFGNMFMAGKIKNVMKMEMPRVSSWKKERPLPGSNTAPHESTTEGPTQTTRRTYSSARPIAIVPDHIVPHLNNLKLPIGAVNEADIKSAYRKAVMQYHPDRMAHRDTDLKPLHEAKFKQSTESYNALIEHYVKNRE